MKLMSAVDQARLEFEWRATNSVRAVYGKTLETMTQSCFWQYCLTFNKLAQKDIALLGIWRMGSVRSLQVNVTLELATLPAYFDWKWLRLDKIERKQSGMPYNSFLGTWEGASEYSFNRRLSGTCPSLSQRLTSFSTTSDLKLLCSTVKRDCSRRSRHRPEKN